MCMLPLTAFLVASEAITASKWLRRPHLASELNSVTSIIYVAMSFWLLNASMRWLKPGEMAPPDQRSATRTLVKSPRRTSYEKSCESANGPRRNVDFGPGPGGVAPTDATSKVEWANSQDNKWDGNSAADKQIAFLRICIMRFRRLHRLHPVFSHFWRCRDREPSDAMSGSWKQADRQAEEKVY